jgi:dethiobiotin synthetase
LDEINPWYFRAPSAPLLAARRERRIVTLAQVMALIKAAQKKYAVTLVEGAGGVLSPLGEGFDARDLLVALKATPLIAAQNRLGAVNQLRLTLAALSPNYRAKAKVILMSPERPDAATKTNAELLAEFFPAENIFQLPWLGQIFSPAAALKKTSVQQTLQGLLG